MLVTCVNSSIQNSNKTLKKKFLLIDILTVKTFTNALLLIFWAMILVGTFRYFV